MTSRQGQIHLKLNNGFHINLWSSDPRSCVAAGTTSLSPIPTCGFPPCGFSPCECGIWFGRDAADLCWGVGPVCVVPTLCFRDVVPATKFFPHISHETRRCISCCVASYSVPQCGHWIDTTLGLGLCAAWPFALFLGTTIPFVQCGHSTICPRYDSSTETAFPHCGHLNSKFIVIPICTPCRRWRSSVHKKRGMAVPNAPIRSPAKGIPGMHKK